MSARNASQQLNYTGSRRASYRRIYLHNLQTTGRGRGRSVGPTVTVSKFGLLVCRASNSTYVCEPCATITDLGPASRRDGRSGHATTRTHIRTGMASCAGRRLVERPRSAEIVKKLSHIRNETVTVTGLVKCQYGGDRCSARKQARCTTVIGPLNTLERRALHG